MKLLATLFVLVAVLAAIEAQSQVAGPLITPYPRSVTFGSTTGLLNPQKFKITTSSSSSILAGAIQRYSSLFFPFGNGAASSAPAATLNIKVASASETLDFGVSENYTISATTSSYTITADTIYGAMRGLETFSQLIAYTQSSNSYSIPFLPIVINDYPRFPWRGIMIDTGRHFQPASYIMHLIEGLSYSKFNTLHWHVTDTESFGAEVPNSNVTNPYNSVAVWSTADIQAIVAHGKSYGVRVVPEFDVPAHSYSWRYGAPDMFTNCPSYYNWMDQVPMSPASDNALDVVKSVFTEMSSLFVDSFFHTGGDELALDCWNEDPAVKAWMAQKGFSTVQTEQYFEDYFTTVLQSLNRTKVVWNDPYSNGVALAKDTVVHVWDSTSLMQSIVNDGYRAIASFDYYLNDQIPVSGQTHYEWQDTWQDFYGADPLAGISSNGHLVIGGEGCIWGEQADQFAVDVRVFPRALGISERLWSDESLTDVQSALTRIGALSCRISQRGIASGPLFPDFCLMPDDVADYLETPRSVLSREEVLSILRAN
ncbi:hypothetical protein SAMD00019534_047280 [Acytostelium subglobosum LB1]|uniref:hypothetical protein n=1 Tax=Acytostelium subglobosum LB1 TaxID=1410327 RepID=UPI000644947F|nr:hypothetical protein SAMD00019534_047280 [Acytostelium subglobosum LB1]GAM21553.1 hypothetical protein SAMD00019534_047280 [Acytostelium subglobosum LB1]|eukprot:XP_012755672.1 hypothetical protein SAMD00019534_047280 [Acytostelium subglobosum LB1]